MVQPGASQDIFTNTLSAIYIPKMSCGFQPERRIKALVWGGEMGRGPRREIKALRREIKALRMEIKAREVRLEVTLSLPA